MRIFFISILLLQGAAVFGQQELNPYAPDFIQYRFKGYVVLNDYKKLKIHGLSYIDTTQLRFYINTSGGVNNHNTKKADVLNMETQTVSINKKILQKKPERWYRIYTLALLRKKM